MTKTKQISIHTVAPASLDEPKPRYNIEFFHIYTDETIDSRHGEGLESLRSLQRSWSFEYDKIVMIDNYNPTVHRTTAEEILEHLRSQGMEPEYWAYEADMVSNAKLFLDSLPESKIKRSYVRYIENHGKFPCSLLTATWYLTRLGRFDMSVIKASNPYVRPFEPALRLFNLLPEDYKPVEQRAHELILASDYRDDADRIQDFFYPVSAGRAVDLF